MRASVVAVKNNTKPRAADVDAAIFIQTAESEKANERRTPFLLGPRETRREEGWSWFVRPSVARRGGVVYDALSRT